MFDTEENSFTKLKDYNEFDRLKSAKVHFLRKASEKEVWIGTNDGLFLGDIQKGITGRFGSGETGGYHLPAQNFFHMSDAKDGGYWLGTMSGLIKWDISDLDSNWELYNIEDGLSNQEILAAYEDDYGFVWMPTPQGLIQFDDSTKRSKTYLKVDGLSSAGFQNYAHCQGKNGTLYFGGYQGFNIFHPKDFKDVDFNPKVPLIVTDFEKFNADSDQIENKLSDFIENPQIILYPRDRFFNIRVALSDYRGAEHHKFAYKIEGFQEDWNEGKSSLIRISGLPYGDYNLRIKGQLPNGLYAKPELVIPIHVLKPFYLQAWFIALAMGSVLLSLFLFYKWRTDSLIRKQADLEIAISEATQALRNKNIELENLDKIKSRFFANVSHELRTPLTIMLGPLSTMLKSQKLDNRNYTLANMAKQNTKHLLNLVNEILNLTKLESDKLELKEENVAVYFLIQRLVSAFESHAHQRNIQFEFNSEIDKYLQVRTDPNIIEKVINNLLSNAFKFTKEGGKITLKVEDKASHLQIKVSDTGRGIHPNDLPLIFNRFYQSEQPDTPKEGGTGIGLSLCMELIKLMDGKLWVESTLGIGSHFYFNFPKTQILGLNGNNSNLEISTTEETLVLQHKGNHIEELSKADHEFITNDRPIILVVEDNQSLRAFLHIILEGHYIVQTAENGRVALEILTATKQNQNESSNNSNSNFPDLIISDIMMPEMDGYQLLEKMKSTEELRNIPVVMLTARAEMQDKLKALRIGVDDYMLKPFEEEELLVRVQNLLKHGKVRRMEIENSETSIVENNGTIEPSHSKEEQDWLVLLETEVLDKLEHFDFSVTDLAKSFLTNRWQLNTRIKRLTGLTTNQYIQEVRLNHARYLLETNAVRSVKEVTSRAGLKDVKYFSRQFKQRFGRNPSTYL